MSDTELHCVDLGSETGLDTVKSQSSEGRCNEPCWQQHENWSAQVSFVPEVSLLHKMLIKVSPPAYFPCYPHIQGFSITRFLLAQKIRLQEENVRNNIPELVTCIMQVICIGNPLISSTHHHNHYYKKHHRFAWCFTTTLLFYHFLLKKMYVTLHHLISWSLGCFRESLSIIKSLHPYSCLQGEKIWICSPLRVQWNWCRKSDKFRHAMKQSTSYLKVEK